MILKRLLISSMSIVMLLAAGVASASPVFFSNNSAWNVARVSAGYTNTFFEDFNSATSAFTGTNYSDNGLNINSLNTMSAASVDKYCGGGECLVFNTPTTAVVSQTFTFDIGAVGAFTMNIGDLASLDATAVTIGVSSGDEMTYFFPHLGAGATHFFGVVDSTNLFSSVTLTIDGPSEVIGIDNVLWAVSAPVPEPAPLLLLSLGLIGLFGRSRSLPKKQN